jgi:hypothetical protein
VKPRVLALDFGGTIAVNDTIDVNVAAAIHDARRATLLAVLVSGDGELGGAIGHPEEGDASSARRTFLRAIADRDGDA